MRNALFDQQFPGGKHSVINTQYFPNQVFFVDSTNTTNGTNTVGAGINPDVPFLTLAYALTQCTADKGDTIFLMPGHAENIAGAAGIAISVGGVRIYGLGKGAKRPTLSFITSTAATITIAGNDVHIENVVFKNGIDALVNMLTISGADVTLQGCEINDNNASFACLDPIVTTAAANRLRILDHVHRGYSGKAGAHTAIKIVGGADIVVVPDSIVGDFSVAAIQNVTTACTNLRVYGRASSPAYISNLDATLVCITLHASSTGQVGPNIMENISTTGTSSITNANVGAAMSFYQPITITNATGKFGLNSTIAACTNA